MTQNFSVHVLQQHRHHQENNAPHAKKLGRLSVSKSFVANFSPPIPRIERENSSGKQSAVVDVAVITIQMHAFLLY